MSNVVSNRRPMLIVLSIGLLLMLGAGLSYFTTNPGLVQHTNSGPAQRSEPVANAPSDGVLALMQALEKNPNDLPALLGLVQHYTHTQEWDKAEKFALHAVLAAPANAEPPYVLGVVLHGQGRHKEAAAALEKSLSLKNDPSVAYSLGVLYGFYLNDPAQGKAKLELVLAANEADPALKKDAAATIEQLSQMEKK